MYLYFNIIYVFISYLNHKQDTLGEFWVNEMQHWKGIGESDSKTEINGIEDAWTRGKAAHSHMKLWFDKIQVLLAPFLLSLIYSNTLALCVGNN